MMKHTLASVPKPPDRPAVGARSYTLIGADGRPYQSAAPGTLGGHRRRKAYGRLDCRAALSWIAKGYYVPHRVFFADEATAIAAGYRPCAVCMPAQYRVWKEARPATLAGTSARRAARAQGATPAGPLTPP